MYLSQLKLWNFRQFGSNDFNLSEPSLTVNFKNGLNVLIGKNDSGKSAIIDAIKLVLKTHSVEWIAPYNDDFHRESKKFRIELRFDDFTDDEAKYFTEWLSWEGEGDDAKVFLRVIYHVEKPFEHILPTDVRAGIDDIGYPLTAEAREQLKVTYLRPLRDAANELIPRKDSRLSKIFYGHEAFRGKEKDHALISNLDDFCKSIESFFVDDASGKVMKDTIGEYIKSFCDDSKEIGLTSFGRGNLRGILEKLELSVTNEINLGLGTQNRLFMASELLHLEKSNWEGLRLGLIEELEAHLHPQAQMKVVESLQKRGNNIQLILTTHSPNLASKVKLENIIVCNNGNAFPLGKDYTELEEKDYKFLEKFLDVTKSNLFFAKGVILVEGWAEEILIPSLAKNLGFDLTKFGVSIVNVGSVALLNYSKIFLRKDSQEMNIPVSIITDVDVREYEKTPELDDEGKPKKDANNKVVYEYIKFDEADIKTASTKKITERKTHFENQKVKAFFAPNWTLEFSISKSVSLSGYFQEVVKDIHSGTNWNDDFEKELAKKLLNKGLEKTEIAYQLAQKLDDSDALTIEKTDSIYYLVEAIKYACGH